MDEVLLNMLLGCCRNGWRGVQLGLPHRVGLIPLFGLKRIPEEFTWVWVTFDFFTGVRMGLRPALPSKYSPLNRNDEGNQGYLFPLPPAAGRMLLSILDRRALETDEPDAEADLSSAIRKLDLPETQRLALVNSRIGQGPFRDNLLTYWSSKCVVTGLSEPKLLTASHIKPWRDSNNKERLDLHNGLLLSPSYDALFDKGFIPHCPDGLMN
jgi:hypothetical protein